ncbi:hypothetical protein FQZ97_843660 [compost metagenome]
MVDDWSDYSRQRRLYHEVRTDDRLSSSGKPFITPSRQRGCVHAYVAGHLRGHCPVGCVCSIWKTLGRRCGWYRDGNEILYSGLADDLINQYVGWRCQSRLHSCPGITGLAHCHSRPGGAHVNPRVATDEELKMAVETGSHAA